MCRVRLLRGSKARKDEGGSRPERDPGGSLWMTKCNHMMIMTCATDVFIMRCTTLPCAATTSHESAYFQIRLEDFNDVQRFSEAVR